MRKTIGIIVSVCMTAGLIACGDVKDGDSGKIVSSGYSVTATSVSGGSSDAGQTTSKKEQVKYRFNDYESVWYKDVVWTAMSEKMSEEDYEQFCEYLPALTGEAVVHWQAEEDEDDVYTEEDEFQGSDQTIQQVFDMLREVDEDGEEEAPGEVSSILFWDMTGDGVKELILETPYGGYKHFIIHKEGNEFYGTAYVRRWFQSPQKSGYFWIGKGNGGWNYLSFKDKKFEIISVTQTELKWGESEAPIEERYYIQDKKVNKKKYKEWEKKNLTGRIKEYELPEKVEEKHE